MSSPPDPTQASLDADERLGTRRLLQFVRAMIPIAIAYLGVFVGGALAWSNVALGVGSVAIVVYTTALIAARGALRRDRTERAALYAGGGLLAMISIAVFAVHFQYPAFTLMAIAAVVVVLPHVRRRALWWFGGAAVGIVVIVTVVGALPPALPQPPAWFCEAVLLTSLCAASCLIILMLAADHRRMRGLLHESTQLAGVAQRQQAATDAFLVAASHQFRTPVSTLLLQSEALVRGAVDDKSRVRMQRMLRAAERLHLLVDTMLDVSRITQGALQLDRSVVDVAAIVRSTVATQAADARDAGVELVLEAPPPGASASTVEVEADARRLELMTSHLIENAVRHGKGAPAVIEVRADAADVLIAVTDAGTHREAPMPERAFDRDVRPSAQSERDGGPAVGLWLVRELSHAMGGRVSASVAANGSMRFEVRLPRKVA